MPGIVGYVLGGQEAVEGLLKRMASALEPEDRFGRELYLEHGLGLGRVSLGILNPEPQPIWNEAQDICLVMEGEIYDYREMKGELLHNGHVFKVDNDAEFALHLYEQYGEEFALRLNGAFIIAIWDRREQKLVIANDRMGLQPLYYAQVGEGLLFASGVRALLAEPKLPRKVDRVAISQFLTFDHILDDRTLLEAVKLMPQANVLTFQQGQLMKKPYWWLRYAETYPLQNEEDLEEGLLFNLRRSTARQASDDREAGLLLSGGLDSRVVLGLLAEAKPREKLHAFTWGIPGCDDLRIARELARKAGVRHHFFQLDSDWIMKRAEEAVRITDGMGNLVNLHALATAEEESQIAQVIYKGFLGDAMLGFALVPHFWADYDRQTCYQAHWKSHRDLGIITFKPAEEQALYSPVFKLEVGDSVMESYRAGMDAAQSRQLASQRLYFDLRQRVPRMTIKGVEVMRSRVGVRLPFSDNDLIEFTTQVPPGYLLHRLLVRRAFSRAFPELAKVPCTATDNLPLMACARDVTLRAKHLVQWHLREKGLGRLAGSERRQYKDYDGWFRTIMRSWVEDTLLSERALERGYFNPDGLRMILTEHMAGKKHTVGIGALLSIEIWHRLFVD